jgi:hypothetical protein
MDCAGTFNIRHGRPPVSFVISDQFSDSEKAAIRAAAKTWNATTREGNLIVLSNSGFLIRKDTWESNQQGITNISYQNGYVTRTEIVVNTAYIAYVDLESLMLHEFGHALGLGHVSGGTMDPTLKPNEIRRSIDESSLRSIQCLYPELTL